MNPEDFQKLQQDVQQLKLGWAAFNRSDHYAFWKIAKFYRGPIFGGLVDSTGTAISLPQNWTSAHVTTGQYTVTHGLNLDTNAYAVMVTASGINTYPASVVRSANSFEVNLGNLTAGQDVQFSFVLMLLN